MASIRAKAAAAERTAAVPLSLVAIPEADVAAATREATAAVRAAMAARSQIAAALMHLASTRMAVVAALSLEWATEVALTTRVHVPIFHQRRLNSEMIFGERASVLETPAVDCSDAPSHVSHRRTIHRRCSRIFCAASHTVADNKFCVIYLIFYLDLNYIMGSQWQWIVFQLLELLSVVNMQL